MKFRYFPYLLITICLSAFAGCKPGKKPLQIDHVILAVDNLDKGIQQFEKATGIKPQYGGGHPNGDTHNATVALTGGMYVEILAPKNDLDAIPEFFSEMHELTPIGFAVSVDDIEKLEKDIEKFGFQTNGIEDWSRKKPNGEILQWKLLMVNEPQLFMNPFFIRWSQEIPHPSNQDNIQASLLKLTLATPHKKAIEKVLGTTKSIIKELDLKEKDEIQINFKLNTPKGTVVFD